MEESQDILVAQQGAKRRGRKPKSATIASEESTVLDISEKSGSNRQDKERGKQNKKAPRAVISWKDKEESLDNQISSSESSSEGYNRGNLGLEGHMTPESAYE